MMNTNCRNILEFYFCNQISIVETHFSKLVENAVAAVGIYMMILVLYRELILLSLYN